MPPSYRNWALDLAIVAGMTDPTNPNIPARGIAALAAVATMHFTTADELIARAGPICSDPTPAATPSVHGNTVVSWFLDKPEVNEEIGFFCWETRSTEHIVFQLPPNPVLAYTSATRSVDIIPGALYHPRLVALLIQSRGTVNQVRCSCCQARDGHELPFVECISIPGEWASCCGNCKWQCGLFEDRQGACCSKFLEGHE